jgi:chromosome segregation protein
VFLKSLTLKGFKSFAEATTLEFEPGVTVVVGPNGSGKSNIVDAVAWVLGAQGPRTVRSSKMEDVIFAGTSKRPALGRAEVALTIDNQSGLLPIDFSEVTVTRTLFRSGDSEYAINGVPCRLLDVQELLSDTGVGRQQHVIVSQGQLDAVLNARPEERRLIIEEAAGVLKYRRRRERAQRRLESTETSLLRLQDLLREVRRQLRPLERQAEAARRHGDLVAELRAVRRHLAGRELATVEARLTAGHDRRVELARAEHDVVAALAALDADVVKAEAELSATHLRAERLDLADALSRAEGLRATARGLSAVLAERQRSVQRDRAAGMDHGVIASLEGEGARLTEELAALETDAMRLEPRVVELAEAESSHAAEARAFAGEWAEGAGPTDRAAATDTTGGPDDPDGGDAGDLGQRAPEGAAAEARGELIALRAGVDRARAEFLRLDDHLATVAERAARLEREAAGLRTAMQEADEAERPLLAAVDAAEARRTSAERALTSAEEAHRAAEAEQQRWSARVDALALALDEARARAGAERLVDVAGVVGTLLDLVEVDEGWQEAFEAAAGEAVAAVVVDGVPAARVALELLHQRDLAGAVLAFPDAAGATITSRLPFAGEPVRGHVRARLPAVNLLLDRLLDLAVAVEGGWPAALELSLADPELVVVTMEGDRFASTAWRTGVAGTGATGAALDEARTRAAHAAEVASACDADVRVAAAQLAHAQAAEAEPARQLDINDGRLAAASDALQRVEAEHRDAVTEAQAQEGHRAELAERLTGDSQRVAELEYLLPALEDAAAAEAQRIVAERAARARLAERTSAVAALRRDLEVRAAGLEERRTMLTRRRAEVEQRLARHATERDEAAGRRQWLDRVAAAVRRLATTIEARTDELDRITAELRDARRQEADLTRSVSDRLEQLRRRRAAAERQLVELRERLSRIQLDEADASVRLETLVETIRRELDCEPDATRDAGCPPLPPGTAPASRVRELERELRLMGPINPLALEEHTALQERHAFLEAQLDDVRAGRRELAKVIRAVDSEIVEVFRAAFADVADNFETLFATLFPGGQGRLRLTDPDHLLETGIEIDARPSGKNVRRLSLLSGGERSLTALAFLFAVFRSRPSPFYLMDEVEAALDDVNLHRFLDLIHEFREEAQLLVVSHQKRTMEAADCLYGVTMQPGGSSRVLSERVATGS